MNEKVRIAVFGACYTREAFNSEFIPNWKENFEVTTTRFQNSVISMMSMPIPYSRKNMPLTLLQNYWSGTLLQNLLKDWMNVLTANPPTVLLMDFWGDLIGVFKVNNNNSCLSNCRRNLIKEKNRILDSYFLDEISINIDKARFMRIWKNKFDIFMRWKKKYLPDTHIIINGKLGSNCEKYTDGSHVLIDEQKVKYYNECMQELLDYAKGYNLEIISYDEKEFYRNPYVTRSMVHFTKEYYEFFYNEIVKRCEKYKGITLKSTSNDNLIINSDFRYGTLFWKTYMEDMKINGNSVYAYGKKNGIKYMWSNDIELIEYHREITISFECKVKKPERLRNTTIFLVRTFDKRNLSNKKDAVEEFTIKYDSNAKAGEFFLYKYTFVPQGKIISVAPFTSGDNYIEWKNIKVNTGGYSPWNTSLTEQRLITDKYLLVDFNNPPILCYRK